MEEVSANQLTQTQKSLDAAPELPTKTCSEKASKVQSNKPREDLSSKYADSESDTETYVDNYTGRQRTDVKMTLRQLERERKINKLHSILDSAEGLIRVVTNINRIDEGFPVLDTLAPLITLMDEAYFINMLLRAPRLN